MDILIEKSRRLLTARDQGVIFLRVPVRLGFGADDGPKLREGDGRTPEGNYVISSRNPASRFFRSLGLSYPNPRDALRGLQAGLIDESAYRRIVSSPNRPAWDTPLGGFVMIHGTPPARRGDWTHAASPWKTKPWQCSSAGRGWEIPCAFFHSPRPFKYNATTPSFQYEFTLHISKSALS